MPPGGSDFSTTNTSWIEQNIYRNNKGWFLQNYHDIKQTIKVEDYLFVILPLFYAAWLPGLETINVFLYISPFQMPQQQ